MFVIFQRPVLAMLLMGSLSIVSFSVLALEKVNWLSGGQVDSFVFEEGDEDFTHTNKLLFNPRLGVNKSVELINPLMPDLDATVMLTKHIGAEVLLNVHSRYTFLSKNNVASASTPGDILGSRALPQSFILQYHLMPDAKFRPYVGLGVNYTYLGEEAFDSLDKHFGGVSEFRLTSPLGWTAQVGTRYEIGNNWFLNADLKYLGINTTANFKSNTLGNTAVGVTVDPWIFGVGIGKRF